MQVVGWGKTSANGVESEVLLQGDIDIMPPQYCQRRIYQPLLFDKFCGVKNGGKNIITVPVSISVQTKVKILRSKKNAFTNT